MCYSCTNYVREMKCNILIALICATNVIMMYGQRFASALIFSEPLCLNKTSLPFYQEAFASLPVDRAVLACDNPKLIKFSKRTLSDDCGVIYLCSPYISTCS